MDRVLVTAEDLARIVRVQPSTILQWARGGTIPCVRINAKVLRFDPDAVVAALSERPVHRPIQAEGGAE